MAVRILRIITNRADKIDYEMSIVAPVDEERRIVTKGWSVGFMRNKKNSVMEPFIGRGNDDETSFRFPLLLDFGTDFEDDYRFYWTNLTHKRIQKGEQFTIRMQDGDMIYEIMDLFDMVQHRSIDSL